MKKIQNIIERVKKTQRGFLDIQKASYELYEEYDSDTVFKLCQEFYEHEAYQVRALATFVFGYLAATSNKSLLILKEKVSLDKDWRVQEILAKAFDTFCADIGYEQSLPYIHEWLKSSNPNQRRAVTEGLRIWTSRSYFDKNPDIAISLLGKYKNDESEYVRKSVGNALRDISKKHRELVEKELESWNITHKNIHQTYKLAIRFIAKNKG
ncbi:DNA alkylation repair protein [Candidatus Fermentibacteria bacterium]|nr:MAG: DNA alkylation repair protein [Candidatus Fermentibacteria bacterium]